ncbi:hypothetical protein [Streptomyces sp. NPDC127039]|uniref:hypothetical protein n=1 Tax=Streptomyces sp. NPDC127039 TaxID=3347115 RepID=UPI00364C2B5A
MKLLREVAGLTQAQYGEAQIAAVEQGRGLLAAMKEEVAKARYPSFFRRYVHDGGDCVEIADADATVWVRDTKHSDAASPTSRALLPSQRLLLGTPVGEVGLGQARSVRPLSRAAWNSSTGLPSHS